MGRSKGNGGDTTLGLRIMHLRKIRGLSQSDLGKAVGVSFQQIQKYEKGANRITSARLMGIAATLGVTVDQLAGVTAEQAPVATTLTTLDLPGVPELLIAYGRITNPEMRKVALASMIAISRTAANSDLAAQTAKLASPG